MELGRVLVKHLAPSGEDALDFRELALLELHKFVIERQDLERLDEDRGARGARAVDDALDAPLFLHFHRQNEPVVPERDHRVLKHTCRLPSPYQFFERPLNLAARVLDGLAQSPELRAGGRVQRPVGQDFSSEGFRNHAKVRQRSRVLAHLPQCGF